MAAPGRFERVRTEHGWHGRIVGGNDEIVWTTEKYPDKRQVAEALDVFVATLHGFDVVTFTRAYAQPVELIDVDERPPGQLKPHARLCGYRLHAHGYGCHSSCPTCGGKPT